METETMKTVLITGSNRGLGKSLAFKFIEKGYSAILHARDASDLRVLKKTFLRGRIERCVDIVEGDIRSKDVVYKLAQLAEARDIDVLVNNAGVYANRQFTDMAHEDFQEMVDVNLLAPIFLTLQIFPVFQRKRSGLVININSLAGRNPAAGETGYCASKYGLRGFSEALQFDATKDNIRVVEIYPGAMDTDMVEGRKDLEKCIDTCDVADLVVRTCREYSSMRVCGIEIRRRNY